MQHIILKPLITSPFNQHAMNQKTPIQCAYPRELYDANMDLHAITTEEPHKKTHLFFENTESSTHYNERAIHAFTTFVSCKIYPTKITPPKCRSVYDNPEGTTKQRKLQQTTDLPQQSHLRTWEHRTNSTTNVKNNWLDETPRPNTRLLDIAPNP